MIRRVHARGFAAIIVFGLVAFGMDSVCLAQKTLAWKFPKGRVIKVVLEQETDMKLESGAALTLNETHATQTTDMVWTVQEVTLDGVASVEQTISRIVLAMKSRVGEFVIDTNNDKPLQGIAETIANGIRPMAGARFVAKTKANGEVVDFIVPEDVAQKLGDGSGGLGASALREITHNGSMQFPDKPVNVGDTWSSQFEMEMRLFGKLLVSTNYQYLGEEVVAGQRLDKIKATTAMRAIDPNDSSGLKLSKQESTGTIWFDNGRGSIDHSEFQQEIGMDVKQGGTQIKQVVNQKLKLTFRQQ